MTIRKRADLEAREGVDRSGIARKSAGSLVYVLSILGATLLVVFLSANLRTSWDVSITSSNTLSPQTVSVLEGLENDVRLHALFTRRDERKWEDYRFLLDRYQEASDRVSVEFIDPVERPGRVAELGLNPQETDLRGGLTLVARDESHRLTFRGTDEEAITNAILEVGRDTRRVTGFIRGFGERDIRSRVAGGYAKLAVVLAQEYYDIVDVDLDRGIPPDVTVLIAPGPTRPIPREELAALHEWLLAGGRFLALLDPGEASGLDEVLERWGLRATGRQIFDPLHNINQATAFIRVEDFGGHPLVEGFGKRLPLALAVSGAVEHFETGEGLLYHATLARSSDVSIVVGEDASRQPGPFAVAAASWLERRDRTGEVETRVVVVGDADLASNAYLDVHANRNFILNCIGWLSRESEMVSIRRPRLAGQVLELTPGQRMRTIIWIAVPPAVVLLFGIVVAIRRRGK